tara:strand:- start:1074 stop:1229 length:156 start_codon:yes stop_codon:yes gene_type:complete
VYKKYQLILVFPAQTEMALKAMEAVPTAITIALTLSTAFLPNPLQNNYKKA